VTQFPAGSCLSTSSVLFSLPNSHVVEVSCDGGGDRQVVIVTLGRRRRVRVVVGSAPGCINGSGNASGARFRRAGER